MSDSCEYSHTTFCVPPIPQMPPSRLTNRHESSITNDLSYIICPSPQSTIYTPKIAPSTVPCTVRPHVPRNFHYYRPLITQLLHHHQISTNALIGDFEPIFASNRIYISSSTFSSRSLVLRRFENQPRVSAHPRALLLIFSEKRTQGIPHSTHAYPARLWRCKMPPVVTLSLASTATRAWSVQPS